jgi:hypothetical protein
MFQNQHRVFNYDGLTLNPEARKERRGKKYAKTEELVSYAGTTQGWK